jgi:hypothetical protein
VTPVTVTGTANVAHVLAARERMTSELRNLSAIAPIPVSVPIVAPPVAIPLLVLVAMAAARPIPIAVAVAVAVAPVPVSVPAPNKQIHMRSISTPPTHVCGCAP